MTHQGSHSRSDLYWSCFWSPPAIAAPVSAASFVFCRTVTTIQSHRKRLFFICQSNLLRIAEIETGERREVLFHLYFHIPLYPWVGGFDHSRYLGGMLLTPFRVRSCLDSGRAGEVDAFADEVGWAGTTMTVPMMPLFKRWEIDVYFNRLANVADCPSWIFLFSTSLFSAGNCFQQYHILIIRWNTSS